MDYFAGLDVSLEETAICVVDDTGKIVELALVVLTSGQGQAPVLAPFVDRARANARRLRRATGSAIV